MTAEQIMKIIGAVLGAAGGLAGIVALLRVSSQNKMDEATSVEKISSAAATLIEPLKAQIEIYVKDLEALKKEVGILKMENILLKDWAARLVAQIVSAGLEPVPFDRRKQKNASKWKLEVPSTDIME